MASNRDQFTTEIYVNNEQAQDAIAKLTKKLEAQEADYKKLQGSLGDFDKKTLKAKKDMEATRQSIAGVRQGTENYRRAIENLSGQSMSQLVKMQKQLKRELDMTKPDSDEWKRLSDEYRQVTERMKSLSDAQRGVTTWMGRLGAGTGGLMGKLGSLGSMITAVPALLKGVRMGVKAITAVVRETVNASQTLSDKWNNGVAAMKTTTDAFFMALSTGDWTVFENGLGGALRKAREFADQLDAIADYGISGKVMNAVYMTEFNAQRAVATDPEATEKERREALGAMKKDLEAYNAFIVSEAEATWKGIADGFNAWKGIAFESQAQLKDFFVRYYEFATTGRDKAANDLKAAEDAMKSARNIYEVVASGIDVPEETILKYRKIFEEANKEYEKLYNSASITTRAIVSALELPDDKKTQMAELIAQWSAGMDQVSASTRAFNKTQSQVLKQIEEGSKKTVETTSTAKKQVDAYAEAIKKIEKSQAAQVLVWKRQYAAGMIDKARYEAAVGEVEEDFLKKKMAAAQKYGKNIDKYMSQLLDRQIARMNKAKELLKEEMDELAQEEKEINITPRNNGIRDREDYDNFQEQLWKKAADIRQSLADESARLQYETEMKWAEKLAEDGKLTTEEAERYKMQTKLKFAQQYAAQMNSITEQVSNFVTRVKELESAQMEAEYQAQLAAAGDNAEMREKIEAEHEQKKLDIQKKYADADMAINIAKTIAAGSLAAMQAFAQLGPIAGAVAAALIAATTAAEIATIVAQRNAIKNAGSGGFLGSHNARQRAITGYGEGGFTGNAVSDKQAVGVVHANEWVAPAWMVRENPVVFTSLERYRKRAGHGYGNGVGFADGGYTTGNVIVNTSGSTTSSDIEKAVYNGIRDALKNGWFRGYVVRKDIRELDVQDLRMKRQTSRS